MDPVFIAGPCCAPYVRRETWIRCSSLILGAKRKSVVKAKHACGTHSTALAFNLRRGRQGKALGLRCDARLSRGLGMECSGKNASRAPPVPARVQGRARVLVAVSPRGRCIGRSARPNKVIGPSWYFCKKDMESVRETADVDAIISSENCEALP